MEGPFRTVQVHVQGETGNRPTEDLLVRSPAPVQASITAHNPGTERMGNGGWADLFCPEQGNAGEVVGPLTGTHHSR